MKIVTGFSKNIFKLLAGNISGKALQILAIPLLARLYTPEDFGEMSVMLSIILLLTPITHLGYAFSIPVIKSSNIRGKLVTISLFLICINTVAFSALLFSLVYFGVLDVDYMFVVYTSLGIFLASIFEVNNQQCIVVKKFTELSVLIFLRAVSNLIFKFAFFLIPQINGLMLGQSLQDILPNLYYLIKVGREKKKVTRKTFFKLIAKLKGFFSLRLPAHLLLIGAAQLPILLSGLLYSNREVGFLAIAFSLVMVPSSLIGNSLSQVFYGEIINKGKSQLVEIKSFTRKINLVILLASTMPCLLIYQSDEWAFVTFFGAEWLNSSYYSSALIVMVPFQLMAVVNIKILHFLNEQKKVLKLNLFRFCLGSLVFCLSFYFSLGLLSTIYIYSLGMAVHYIVTIVTTELSLSDRIGA